MDPLHYNPTRAIRGMMAVFLTIAIIFPAFSLTAAWRASTDAARWVDKGSLTSTAWSSAANYLEIIPDSQYQVIEGWGGCFCEQGWDFLQLLSEAGRDSVIRALFDTSGCNFTFCRTPMAGNDFCIGSWSGSYNYNNVSGDYDMVNFSVARDYAFLIPFMKAAMKYQPGLRLWSSPWVIPDWLQTAIKAGDTKAYAALALYYEKYVHAYRAEGLRMTAVALHNEPDITGPWTSGAMQADFVKNYWGPLFVKDKVPAEMWLGTYWNPDHLNNFIKPVLNDADAGKYLSAVGIQWMNSSWAPVVHASYPDKRIIETETIAWNEPADWTHGMSQYNNMYKWLSQWGNAYMQWNMVLDGFPSSSTQSAPINIVLATRSVVYTPHYYAVKHFSHYVMPGAKHIKAVDNSGITGNKIAFQNTTGGVVLVMANTDAAGKQITIKLGDQMLQAAIPANSLCTFRITIPGATDNTPHPVPAGCAAQAIDYKTITLRWNAAPNVSYYVLYRNGVKIGPTWDTAYVDKGLQELTGYSYQVSAVNMLGTEGAKSSAVSATTPADNMAPVIAAARADSQTSVYVIFSEPVEQASAQNAANYAIDGGVTVSSAIVQSDPTIVRLAASVLTANHDYTLSVRNVRDRAQSHNTIAAGATAQFAYMKAGLAYQYYETSGSLGFARIIPHLTPVRSGIAANIGLSMQHRDSYYALRFSGSIKASATGAYAFYTTSDDGSQLLVDSILVVNNDGNHGMVEKSGTIQLTAGMHAITVLFWQADGGQGLAAAWTPVGGAKQAIPDSVLIVNSQARSDVTGLDNSRRTIAARQPGIRVAVTPMGLALALGSNGPYSAGLYDMNGRILKSWLGAQSGNLRLPPDASAGKVYIVRVTTAQGTLCRQVLVR